MVGFHVEDWTCSFSVSCCWKTTKEAGFLPQRRRLPLPRRHRSLFHRTWSHTLDWQSWSAYHSRRYVRRQLRRRRRPRSLACRSGSRFPRWRRLCPTPFAGVWRGRTYCGVGRPAQRGPGTLPRVWWTYRWGRPPTWLAMTRGRHASCCKGRQRIHLDTSSCTCRHFPHRCHRWGNGLRHIRHGLHRDGRRSRVDIRSQGFQPETVNNYRSNQLKWLISVWLKSITFKTSVITWKCYATIIGKIYKQQNIISLCQVFVLYQ